LEVKYDNVKYDWLLEAIQIIVKTFEGRLGPKTALKNIH